ncbi:MULTISPECIES: hypothetical protein [unclassified Nocardia]|uniref:hypothetical protein n=1 Tax=unclassified Nocardia TaxID=2637762 RepID=UPI00278C2A80|nr:MULTISPECIES: hypothetical protein [unclassified Nocardia]
MDRELAERAAADEPADGDRYEPEPPTPVGYTLTNYLLLTLIDSVRSVSASVIAAAGVKPPEMRPMPRPQTALDRVREEQRVARLAALIDIFAPHEHAR